MAVPLRHFLVALGFLLAGAVVGVAAAAGVAGLGRAHVHLLLAGWVCVTIVGATTQFVPVWSGVELHSERLAVAQLWLVVAGLGGMAVAFPLERYGWLVVAGAIALAGFWTFVYNAGRTLWRARGDGLDVTEFHFAVALGWFLVATTAGLLLATDLAWPWLPAGGVGRSALVGTHVATAVFGAVLTTVFGALYQLATMFAQSELAPLDRRVQRIESRLYPVGVAALATGRLLSVAWLAAAGGVCVAASVAAVGVVLARRLADARVSWTPMLRRYAVVAASAALWGALAVPAWLTDPLAPGTRLGAPGTAHLLAVGVVGVVVLGTLYHVVPFVVWVHRYSDLLGLRSVPAVDDLYDHRIARVDLLATTAGLVALSAEPLGAPQTVVTAGGLALTAGVALVAANLLLVVRRHAPHTVGETLFGTGRDAAAGGATAGDPASGGSAVGAPPVEVPAGQSPQEDDGSPVDRSNPDS